MLKTTSCSVVCVCVFVNRCVLKEIMSITEPSAHEREGYSSMSRSVCPGFIPGLCKKFLSFARYFMVAKKDIVAVVSCSATANDCAVRPTWQLYHKGIC